MFKVMQYHFRDESGAMRYVSPGYIPWNLIEPHEAQALKNHGQSLERLNERGGCDIKEIWCILHDKQWREEYPFSNDIEAHEWLKQYLKDHE